VSGTASGLWALRSDRRSIRAQSRLPSSVSGHQLSSVPETDKAFPGRERNLPRQTEIRAPAPAHGRTVHNPHPSAPYRTGHLSRRCVAQAGWRGPGAGMGSLSAMSGHSWRRSVRRVGGGGAHSPTARFALIANILLRCGAPPVRADRGLIHCSTRRLFDHPVGYCRLAY
jgi:hypothetical protein